MERIDAARASYRAYDSGDRSTIEALISDDFVFYSPPDPGVDRAAYFERCWPNSGNLNTEVLTFDDRGMICRAEVYFGWDLE